RELLTESLHIGTSDLAKALFQLENNLLFLLRVDSETFAAVPPTLIFIEVDAISTNTHPPYDSAWVPHNQSEVRYVFCYHSASTDKSVHTDCDSANNRTICSQRCSFTNQGRLKLIHPPYLTSRINHIGEHHGRTTKHIVFQGHTLVDGNVVLDLDSI